MANQNVLTYSASSDLLVMTAIKTNPISLLWKGVFKMQMSLGQEESQHFFFLTLDREAQ